MILKEVVAALERFAPLPLQESYDNAGLQVGLTEAEEVSGVLLCLDVTEDVIAEAITTGCNVIIAHHPLLFRGLKCVTDATQVERCVRLALLNGIAVYAAHTNLDNARGGVNFKIGERLGLTQMRFLSSLPAADGGSGLLGELPASEKPLAFLRRVKETFGVDCLFHNAGPDRPVSRVALCGGAGDFLLDEAIRCGADVFLTGEMGYHRYFGHEGQLWIGVLGHYQSERFTISLLREILAADFPELKLHETTVDTNPIRYMM